MSDLTLEQALILLDESRQHNAAMLDRLYESLGIDSRDGEIRFKWAMVEIENIKRDRDAALAREAELLGCLCSIQQQCLMQITMSHRLDAESIGQQIYQATGMNESELREKVKS